MASAEGDIHHWRCFSFFLALSFFLSPLYSGQGNLVFLFLTPQERQWYGMEEASELHTHLAMEFYLFILHRLSCTWFELRAVEKKLEQASIVLLFLQI